MVSPNARNALAWAGGAQLVRDIAQFAAMLVFVRILSPEQYGAMAIAQALLAIGTLFSAGSFVGHALQVRDPTTIDWQSHFTAATIWNTGIGLVLIGIAVFLATPLWGTDVGMSLALLSLALAIGAPAEVRNAFLCANHDWARFRLLSLIGSFLGLGAGIAMAMAGFGVIALAVQPALTVLPAAIDLFLSGFRPKWSFNGSYYRDAASFGLNRWTSGGIGAIRGFAEQAQIASIYSLSVNGVYGRSVGLSNLLVYRFGAITVEALYPILSRAERSSVQFRHNAARLLQGVAWVVIPLATFWSIEAEATVTFLYGDGWVEVAHLLPAASALSATGALHFTVTRLLLANESRAASLAIEVGSSLASISLTFLLLPMGLEPYLWSLSVVGGVGSTYGVVLLLRVKAISFSGVVIGIGPPLLASLIAALSIYAIRPVFELFWLAAEVVGLVACFGFVYTTVLLVAFNRPTLEVLKMVPSIERLLSRKLQ